MYGIQLKDIVSLEPMKENGNSNGPFIYTGFRPQLIAIKNIEQSF